MVKMFPDSLYNVFLKEADFVETGMYLTITSIVQR